MEEITIVFGVAMFYFSVRLAGLFFFKLGRKHGQWMFNRRQRFTIEISDDDDTVPLREVPDGTHCWTTVRTLFADADGILRLDENELAYLEKKPPYAMRIIRDGWGFNTSLGFLHMRARA